MGSGGGGDGGGGGGVCVCEVERVTKRNDLAPALKGGNAIMGAKLRAAGAERGEICKR